MPVRTNAQNVVYVVQAIMHWQYTGDVTQEKNRLNVLFVASDSLQQVTLLVTAEFTV